MIISTFKAAVVAEYNKKLSSVNLALSVVLIDWGASHLNLVRDMVTDGSVQSDIMTDVIAEMAIHHMQNFRDEAELTVFVQSLSLEEWTKLVMYDLFVCFQSNCPLTFPTSLPNGEELVAATEQTFLDSSVVVKEVTNA